MVGMSLSGEVDPESHPKMVLEVVGGHRPLLLQWQQEAESLKAVSGGSTAGGLRSVQGAPLAPSLRTFSVTLR